MNRDLSKMSLANAYRPRTFDEMIGQDHIINILKAQMEKRESVFHNYLLFGPRGTGKTTSARLIAKGLNCLNLQNGNPCNECNNCRLINEATSIDYIEIDAASHTGVDNIREEVIGKSAYPPSVLKKKIYVIDEVHMLSPGAFNALLKTIEEPKSNVCFILATTEIRKVPETIISRCQVFNFKKVAKEVMIQHLQKICEKENLNYQSEALEMLANISEGCVRDAVKYLDQISILGEINENNVSNFLGIARESTIKDFLKTITLGDKIAIFNMIDQIAQSGIDLSQFAKQNIHYADTHLLEDIDLYLSISQVFGNALELMRWHPYPLISYKIAINNYLNESHKVNPEEAKKEIKNEIVNNTVNTTGNSIPNQIENKVESSISINEGIGELETANPISKADHENTETTTTQSEEKIFEIDETTPQKTIETVQSLENDPITPKPEEEIKNNTEFDKKTDAPSDSIDLTLLWEEIVEEFNDRPTAQSNLKNQAIIEKIEHDVVYITTITPIAEMLLGKEDTIKIVEKKLSDKLGKKVVIKISFESKDNYFARKIGEENLTTNS